MSQKLDKLNTGIKSLDDDLRELFAICEDKKKLQEIKQAIAKKDISSEEFSKIVPEFLITVSFALSDPKFTRVLNQSNEETVGLVEEARTLIEKHFANLFENKIAQSMLDNIKELAKQREGKEFISDEEIRGIEYHLLWKYDSPEIMPAVRMAFRNQKQKILLSTTLDWNGLSFLLKKLSDSCVRLLENGKDLAKLGQVDLSDSQDVLKNIEETLGNLKKMEEIMPIYKAKTEPDKDE